MIKLFRFKIDFQFSKLNLRFQINSNGFSRDRSFEHEFRTKYLKTGQLKRSQFGELFKSALQIWRDFEISSPNLVTIMSKTSISWKSIWIYLRFEKLILHLKIDFKSKKLAVYLKKYWNLKKYLKRLKKYLRPFKKTSGTGLKTLLESLNFFEWIDFSA